jgi:hypothetical protein
MHSIVRRIGVVVPLVAGLAYSQHAEAQGTQRMQECREIRSEIVRQQGIGAAAASMQTNTMMIIAIRTKTQQIIADLESRAADIGCNAAFSTVAPPSPPAERPSSENKRPTFEECFAKCQQFTTRTKEQCFDACIGFGSTGKEAGSATAKAPAQHEFAGAIFSKRDGHLVVEEIGPRSEVRTTLQRGDVIVECGFPEPIPNATVYDVADIDKCRLQPNKHSDANEPPTFMLTIMRAGERTRASIISP